MLATAIADGVGVVLEVPADEPALRAVARAKAILARVLLAPVRGTHPLGLSSVCRDSTRLGHAFREAREAVAWAAAGTDEGAERVFAVDDLGPARVFLADGALGHTDSFIEDVLDPLLVADNGRAELLRTMQCFFAYDRSVRAAADDLGVHENTIRYRLGRVAVLTALDVASSASDQLSLQLALRLLEVRGLLESRATVAGAGTPDGGEC